MQLDIFRYDLQKERTLGLLFIDGKFTCYTCEDPVREEKIKGDTAIWAGNYEIKFKDGMTPMTERYQNKFSPWFTSHLEIQDIPEFKHVYIHIGNNEDHTAGCILVGTIPSKKGIAHSTSGFKEMYPIVAKALKKDERVFISIRNYGFEKIASGMLGALDI